jgi:hypothetical protein
MIKKDFYAAPETEVLLLHIENAILTGSDELNDGQTPGWGNGGTLDF